MEVPQAGARLEKNERKLLGICWHRTLYRTKKQHKPEHLQKQKRKVRPSTPPPPPTTLSIAHDIPIPLLY